MADDPLLRLLNTSGFPLQIAVEEKIKRSQDGHQWRVLTTEHPYVHEGQSGFADILLRHAQKDILRMVLECKRRKGALLFLVGAQGGVTKRFRAKWAFRCKGQKPTSGWVDVAIAPHSFESEYCVVDGEGTEKRRTLLEGLAFDVVSAVEGISTQESVTSTTEPMGEAVVYIPTIVTTAQLSICRLDPGDVDLADGIVGSAEFEEVSYIRFRKSLSLESAAQGCQDLEGLKSASERSVMIVSASKIDEFLRDWDIAALGVNQLPWKAIQQELGARDRERWIKEQLRDVPRSREDR